MKIKTPWIVIIIVAVTALVFTSPWFRYHEKMAQDGMDYTKILSEFGTVLDAFGFLSAYAAIQILYVRNRTIKRPSMAHNTKHWGILSLWYYNAMLFILSIFIPESRFIISIYFFGAFLYLFYRAIYSTIDLIGDAENKLYGAIIFPDKEIVSRHIETLDSITQKEPETVQRLWSQNLLKYNSKEIQNADNHDYFYLISKMEFKLRKMNDKSTIADSSEEFKTQLKEISKYFTSEKNRMNSEYNSQAIKMDETGLPDPDEA